MNARNWSLALLALVAVGPGCFAGPEVASHQEDLVVADASESEAERDALARELWLAGDGCVQAARQAEVANLDVHVRVGGSFDQFLFVEIEGVTACAGDARTLASDELRQIRRQSTSPDEGGPDPEPATPDEGGPDPEPATHSRYKTDDDASSKTSSDGTDQQGGEDQGGPDPEPAFGGGTSGEEEQQLQVAGTQTTSTAGSSL